MRNWDHILMASLVDGLEPGELAGLKEVLEHDGALRLHRQGLAVWAGLPEPAPTSQVETEWTQDVLGDTPLAVGSLLTFRLDTDLPLNQVRCVVLRIAGGEEQQLLPNASQGWPTLEKLRQEQGQPCLDLVIEPPGGPQHYLICLVPADVFDHSCLDSPEVIASLLDAARRRVFPTSELHLNVNS